MCLLSFNLISLESVLFISINNSYFYAISLLFEKKQLVLALYKVIQNMQS